MILNDKQISERCFTGLHGHLQVVPNGQRPMIEPFYHTQSNRPSFGVSSFGYDARLAKDIEVFDPLFRGVIDPLDFDPMAVRKVDMYQQSEPGRGTYVLAPGGFCLGHTVEEFAIPDNVMVVCLGKSTYARCGLIINVTPLEPGWTGQVTLELHNASPLPVKIYADRGIAQFLFYKGERPLLTYADRRGRYQAQTGVVYPKG